MQSASRTALLSMQASLLERMDETGSYILAGCGSPVVKPLLLGDSSPVLTFDTGAVQFHVQFLVESRYVCALI